MTPLLPNAHACASILCSSRPDALPRWLRQEEKGVYIQRAEEERNRIVATQFGTSSALWRLLGSGVSCVSLTARIALPRRR